MKKSILLLCFIGALFSAASYAQQLPGAYKLIVGNVAGGTNDILTRIVSAAVGSELKVTAVVENISGGSGALAQSRVVSSPPDGSTIVMAGANQVLIDVINQTDKMKDLVPLVGVAGNPVVLVGRPTLEPKSIDELIAYMRRSPTKLSVAGGGSGTIPHMATALLQQHGKVPLLYVPYRGAPNMLPDLLGGHVDLAVLVLPAAIKAIEAGSVRVYGIFSKTPAAAAPDIPLLGQSKELKGMDEVDGWFSLYVSAKTPPALKKKLESTFLSVVHGTDVKLSITKAGATPMTLDSAGVSRLMEADARLYQDLIKTNNLKFER